jgi:hypothetical protein
MTSRIAPTETWWPLGYSGCAGVLLLVGDGTKQRSRRHVQHSRQDSIASDSRHDGPMSSESDLLKVATSRPGLCSKQ